MRYSTFARQNRVITVENFVKEIIKRFIGLPLCNLAGNGRWLKLGLAAPADPMAGGNGGLSGQPFTPAKAPAFCSGVMAAVCLMSIGALLPLGAQAALPTSFLTAYDAGAGFFGGEDLMLTNASAAGLNVWSSTDPTLAVTNWTLEGVMNEQPFVSPIGFSRYSINVNPATSPVYYIFAPTNKGPYAAVQSVTILTTTDFVNFSVISSNVTINSSGVISFAPQLAINQSGTFVFTSASYPVSESDSTGPKTAYDGTTVNPSVLGARITVTRTNGNRGRLTVGYQISPLTYTNLYFTNYFGTNVMITFTPTNGPSVTTNYYSTNTLWVNKYQFYNYSYQYYNVTNATTNTTLAVNGVVVTPGVTGPLLPIPTNLPPLGNLVLPSVTTTDSAGDVVITITNIYNQLATNSQIVTSASGIATNSGTLTFDDYQMSASILVPVNMAIGPSPDTNDAPYTPSLALISLTSAQLDPLESSQLLSPVLGGPALINALSPQFPPTGPELVNFERSTFRVDKDVAGSNAVISVVRYGTNAAISVSVEYQIDPVIPYSPVNPYDFILWPAINPIQNLDNPANTFPLQAGSEYATPNSDYTPVTGTLTWAANDYNPKTITIPIINNGLVEFNTDFLVQLHNAVPQPTATTSGAILGEVNAAEVTILFDDRTCGQQPAGAVDRCWNPDNVNYSTPPFTIYPGTQGGESGNANGNGGTVYAVAEQPDGKTIIAGSFVSYNSSPYNHIARLLNSGYADTSFLTNNNNGGGANGLISSVVLQPDGRILIGGNFTSFNGYNRHHIARLNSNGSVDTTFNPGQGVDSPNAMVWSMALQPNGQVVIAGVFSSVNGTNINSVARLNADGSLDASFNPGVGPNGVVYAVAVDTFGQVVIGGDFDSLSGANSGGVARLNLDGSLDSTFALGVGTYNPETGSTDPVHALAIQPDGQILVGGSFSYVDLNIYNGLVRLNGADGTVDTSFNPGTGTYNQLTGVSDTVYAITLQPDGNILIGGNFSSFNQTRRVGLARLFSYGSVDTSFMDTAYNQFAGLVNHYSNPTAVNAGLYPSGNYPNFVNSIALEPGTSNVLIGGGFLVVGGGSTRDATHPRSNIARLIGGATPGPGNIQFSLGSYSADKSGAAKFIDLVRTNGNLGPASVTFGTNMAAPGPGIASAKDFSIGNTNYFSPLWPTLYSQNKNWSFTIDPAFYGPNAWPIPQGLQTVTSAYVYLVPNNNTNISGNVNANLTVANPNGNFTLGGEQIALAPALGWQAKAPFTIIDDNIQPGTLGFSAPQFTVTENGGTATITVVRTGGSDGTVDIAYSTSNGPAPNGATNGVDYTGVTNTLEFLATETSHTFTIPIINGTTVRPDRTLNLSLFNVTGGAKLGQTNATLTIINGNFSAGHISFGAASYGANENGGNALVTVNRLGGSSGTISVKAITYDGNAFNRTNYIGSTNTLTWNNGDATTRTITIPVMDDGQVTSDLTMYVRLTNGVLNSLPTANVLGLSTYTNVPVTITNVDSYGTVEFSSANYSVKKSGGYALIPVVRLGGSAQTVTVNYSTVNGTALSNVDYTVTSGSFTFLPGVVSTNFIVPILNTNLNSDLLSLGLVLNGANLGPISSAVLNIIDSSQVNETPGSPDTTYNSFGFNNTVYALALQSNNQLLAGGDFTKADGVPRQRIARLNSDGTLDSSFLLPSSSMGANGTVRSIAVQADGRILVGGQFTTFNNVTLNYIARLNADGSLDSLFKPGSGANNAVYALSETLVNGQSKVLVGGSFASLDDHTFNSIGRLNSDGSPDSTFNPGLGANGTVYALALQPDGKVVIGGDFTAVNGNTNFNHVARLNTDGSLDLSFNVGTGANASVRAISLQLDGRILLGGLFSSVNGNTNFNHVARLNANGSADASFKPGLGANDAVFGIALQTDSRIVLGGEFTRCSGVTRSRITRLNPDGTVDPTINFGWGANNFVAAVVVQEDLISGYPTNVPDEKIIIGGGFTQYDNQPIAYLARIYGGSISGSGAFQFTSANYSADENSTNVTITVLRTGGTSGTNANGSGDVQVPFATSDGTGVANTNYLTVSTNLDFPLGEVIRTVVVPVLDDHVITPNLTVNLALNPVPPAQFGDQPTAVLTIINDDSSISFSAANYQVAKNTVSGVAPISIVRQGSVNGTSTVAFSTTTGGTATIGLDYTPVSNLVTFAPGISNVVMSIPVTNNLIYEGNQTVAMQLTSATGSLLYSPSNATLTIIETVNSPGLFSFAATNYVVTEGGGVGYTNAYITVQRTFGSSGAATVSYSTADGTAHAGTKYVATTGTLTFGDGEISKTFPVPVINGTTAEGPESFSVVLSNPTSGALLTSPTSTTVTILNTNTGIAFVSATNSIREPSGVVASVLTVNLVRYNNTNGVSTVQYSTTNGTALASTNFIAMSGTVTFSNGQSLASIAIPILHDSRVTGDLSFTIGLFSPSADAQLTLPSTTTVVIHDADAGISLAATSTAVAKNIGTALIPVLCSNPSVEPVSVHYSTGPGTAVAGTDYQPTSGILTFTNGQAVNYISVAIVPNNLVESNRNFTVSIFSPTAPGVLTAPTMETVTIVETNSPYGLSFFSPLVISGSYGTTNVDNTGGLPENGDPNIAGFAPAAPVWFQWTAPADGEVSLDTIGSHDDIIGGKLDTVLAVFTGNNLSSLVQVAANDDIYPQQLGTLNELQFNEDSSENIFNTNNANGSIPQFRNIFAGYHQPYGGPSGLRFNAKAGTTYFFAADTKVGQGTITGTLSQGTIFLNWAYHPSGVLRFASEDIDTTIFGTGNYPANFSPMLLYQCSETEGDRRYSGSTGVSERTTTVNTYYKYDAPGLLVTVTRVAGSSGRIAVDYATQDGNTNLITSGSGDIPALASATNIFTFSFGTNTLTITNITVGDYTPVSGTLVFDDYEMSKTIMIPIHDDGGASQPNRDFFINLSNPRVDPADAGVVSAPRVDSLYAQAMCRILDCDIDPKGPSTVQVINTNVTPALTNTLVVLTPTNGVFNFAKKCFRVPRDVQSAYYHGTPVTLYVNRMGTNTAGVTLNYRIDEGFLDNISFDYDNINYPLQPGSDYANSPLDGVIYGTSVLDFQPVPATAQTGTLTFPSGAKSHDPQPVQFTIHNNGVSSFNKDIRIQLYEVVKDVAVQDGMVAECTLTILTDDLSPPAGSVDELYNPDFGVDLAVPTNAAFIVSNQPHPGTEAASEVYSTLVTTNNQTIIGGAFSTYTDGTSTHTVNGLARLNFDGSLDTTFNSGNGINVNPGGQYIRAVALETNNEIVIGGSFTSYDGTQRQCVALVNANGSLDPSFNSAGGANGTVYSVLVQPDGKILIGGAFTAYNGTPRNHVARLNLDGSLDATFDPSNILTGPVYSMAMAPSILFNASGGTNENDNAVNLGPLTSGLVTMNINFNANPARVAPNDVQIYYGDTNVIAGTGVLIYDSGYVTGSGTVVVPFGPTGGITTNLITVVVNNGGNTNGPASWSYTGAVTEPPNTGLLVGGQFGVTGQSYANIARLNPDGTLDTSFSPTTGADRVVRTVAWQLNNQLIAGGDFTHVNGAGYNHLARFNANGSLDTSFAIGTGSDNTVNSVTLQQLAGTMYIGGSFTTFNGTHRLGFARLYNNGTVDTTFLDTAYNQLAGLPRIHFTDAPGTVFSSGLQTDGNVIIGGSFAQVGGGQFDELVRPNDYGSNALTHTYTAIDPAFNTYLNVDVWPEPKTRDGVRNRGNIARLIGGATPGPGNIGLASSSYSANKTGSYVPVSLVRTNGSLGYASANFSVLPGLAQSGVDYAYNANALTYPIEWIYFDANNRPTRQHGDGLTGPNGQMYDSNFNLNYPFGIGGPASVDVSIINNTTSSGNLSAQFQLANPGADQFYLGGQNIPLGVALGASVAPLTVVDNSHQDGVFGFSAGSYPATGSTVSVGVTRTNSSSGTVQLSYTTTTNGSTALPGTDYTPTTGVLTFNPGQTSGAFPVAILQNSYIGNVEKTIGLQLYNLLDLSSGNASLVQSNAVVRIVNPNFAGYLSFTTNAYAANLSSGMMPVTVTRTVGSQGTLTVQYATANGTAVNGTDYTGTTNTLTWNNGDTSSRTITIPLINNHLVGPNKQFFAGLFNATLNGTNTPSLFGSITNVVLNINNDNSYGTFQFSRPSYLVNENGGYATMTVTRTGSALGTATVGFTTVNGTAFAGTNYVSTNGALAFAAGQISRSFNVQILNDSKANPPPSAFYFSAVLTTNSAGSSLGSPASAPVDIVDAQSYNEPAGSPDAAFDPSAGMNGSVFAVGLQSGGQIIAGGNFTIVNGSTINRLARLNADGTLDDTFLNGQSGADAAVNALITQTDDRIVVGGAFANIDGIVRHRIARLQTDGELDTSFNPGAGADNTIYALNETFINGAREIYVGGAFSTLNGTATPGVARLNNDGSLDTTFATGLGANGTVYAVVAYPSNSIANAGKVLVGGSFTNFNNVTVGNLVRLNVDGSVDTNFNVTVGASSAVRAIAIQGDESVLLGGDFTSVNGTALNHVARLNADGTVDAAFVTAIGAGASSSVNAIAVQPDNRIVLVGDFTQANGVNRNSITRLLPTGAVDPTINFGDGANNNIYALAMQPADGMFVIGGAFTTYDTQPHQYIARIYGRSTVGSGAFEFTTPNYSVNENGGYAVITVRRTGGTSGTNADGSGDVFVTFATSNNTAVAGVNYGTIVTNLDFPVGETFKTVLVPVMDDLVITPNLTVNLKLSNPTAPAGFGNQSAALLTIVNTDSALRFLSTSYSAPKNAVTGVATIDIIRQGSTIGSCSVNFLTTTNGSAASGIDYYPTNVTVTFNAGETDKTAQVPIINNAIPEGYRTVGLVLTNTVGALLYSPSNATLTIIDTVYAAGQFSFESTNFTFSEGNTNAYLAVLRTNGSSGAVSIPFTTVAGTAQPGRDYNVMTNTVNFRDGDTSNSIIISLVQNGLVQPPVSLSVQLLNPTDGSGAQIINPSNTTLTIVSDNTGVSFVSGTNYVNESTNYGLVYVQRIGVATNAFAVNYATADGTALSNVNYSVTAGTLNFASGEVLKSVSVPLINAQGVTNVAFNMMLNNPTAGVQLVSPSNAVVIIQPSNAGLSFTNSAMSVSKNVGLAVITVVCSNPGIEPVASSNTVPLSVYYFTSDGTAVAGQDYTNTTGTLVFTNGVGTNTFTVPIINNSLITGNRSFTVNLANATPPGKITSPSTQVVTIIDSNSGLSFSSATYTILKTGVATNITVVRTDNTNTTSQVSFATADGTAVAGTDYFATNGVLTFTNGVTSQTFALRVIATTTEQPDKTVLLSLSNPTNGILVSPSAAILTIRDNSGSLVVPAGSALISESYTPANGIIDPGETVNMFFGLRISAGTNANVTATLLATNGVTPLSGPQNYGTLVARGPSAFRAFSFMANGTNSQRIAPTFQLANNLGQVAFTFTLGTWTNTFANTNIIIINDVGPASPYPSMISVSNMNGVVIKATVTLTNIYHTHPSDIDALVVSPSAQTSLIMAHTGGGNAIGKVSLTFDDAATNSLPPTAYPQTTITNGTFKPTSYLPKPVFP